MLRISGLAIGDSVHVSDLKIENVEIHGSPEATIVAVVPPAVEKVETPAEGEETAAAEPEVIAKGKKDEEEAARRNSFSINELSMSN